MALPRRKLKNLTNPEEIITAKEIAFKYKICLSKAYILMHDSGKAFYIGRSIRMFNKDVIQYIKSNNTSSGISRDILDNLNEVLK